ncbi:translocation/assembly module TamB domain-containing protein [Porphyromonas pogonae]|uniref:translocation/assembly module TamB domain-containing protein n=1 Tax=Porphyromonas pogonae TaxID=867595 RepID=UPI002E76975D|nr:hypothetical protein [Porphyromonas pogonae]
MAIRKRLWKRIILSIILLPIALVLLAALLLYTPPVQKWAIKLVAEKASKATGMDIKVKSLHLSFPLKIVLDDVVVVKPPQDTMLRVGELHTLISPLPLLSNDYLIPVLKLKKVRFSMSDSTGLSHTKVLINSLDAYEVSIKPDKHKAKLGNWYIDDAYVYYSSTDTVKKPEEKKDTLLWNVSLNKLDISRLKTKIIMPYDSLLLDINLPEGKLRDVKADLKEMHFKAGYLALKKAYGLYAQDSLPARKDFFDYKHIYADDLNLIAEKIDSHGSELDLRVRKGSFKERSGLVLEYLKGRYQMDSLQMSVTDISMRTSKSELYGSAQMPWNIFRGDTTAKADIGVQLSLGLEDFNRFSDKKLIALREVKGEYGGHRESKESLPPIDLTLFAKGSLTELNVDQLSMFWLTVMDFDAEGKFYNLTNDKTRAGDFKLSAGFQEQASSLLSFINKETAAKYHIPQGMTIDGDLKIKRGNYNANLLVRDRNSKLTLKGLFAQGSKTYQADILAHQFNLRRFMPKDSLGIVEATIKASGQGTDILSERSRAAIRAKVDYFNRGKMVIKDLTLDGSLKKGVMSMALNSTSSNAMLTGQIDALLNKKRIDGSMFFNVDTLDLYSLGFYGTPLSLSLQMNGEIKSDLKETHHITADITDTKLRLNGKNIDPKAIKLLVDTRPDSIKANVTAGDLYVNIGIGEGINKFKITASNLSKEINKNIESIIKEQDTNGKLSTLVRMLPTACLDINMGRENALRYYLQEKRIAFNRLDTHIKTSAQSGITGFVDVKGFMLDTLRVNSAQLLLETYRYEKTLEDVSTDLGNNRYKSKLAENITGNDSLALGLNVVINKEKYRNQKPFIATMEMLFNLQQAKAGVALYDSRNQLQHKVEALGRWDKAKYGLKITSDTLLLAYNKFKVNSENYIYLHKKDKRIQANLDLTGADSSLISLHSVDSVPGYEELHLLVQRLELSRFKDMPFMPEISGTVFTDLRFNRNGGSQSQPVITGDLSINKLKYQNKELGHIASALFYEPRDNNSHYITGEISYNGIPALMVNGIYQPQKEGSALTGTIVMEDFPLAIANPFIGKEIGTLEGIANGKIDLGGDIKAPLLTGKFNLANAWANLTPYGTRLKLDSIPIRLEESKIFFDRYKITSSADLDNPFVLNGSFVLMGNNALQTDLTLKGNNITIINTKLRHADQLVYGKLVGSTNFHVTGTAQALKVRGDMSVQGGTNCTYVVKGGTLNTNDRMSDVVTFTDFADTLFTKEPIDEKSLGGLDMVVNLHIDPSVQLRADLSSESGDFVEVIGGGDFNFTYPPYGEMSLTGKYAMVGGGNLKYTMPVVGAKKFEIDPKSYISWNGNPMNPYIDFLANQKVKANVSEGGRASQRVNFVVSVKAKETLEKLNVTFDLNAPENLSIQNILSGMNPEERGKQAIGLMATGVFLASQSSGQGFNFDHTLSSVLQSQINNMFGKVLQGTDFNLGMEVHDGADGGNVYTDYTYSFSKRFYNDRLRAVIGGKVQSGNVPTDREQTFIDNFALEYQLDQAGSQFLKIFHQRTNDNILEGELTETGGSYIFRRKLNNILDIFRKKKPSKTPVDSIPQNNKEVPDEKYANPPVITPPKD